MGGSSSAPKPDKNIGRAAMRTAEIGEDYLGWMQEQAKITNRWATGDRARYENTFEPLQDQFIDEAQGYDTAGRRADMAGQARADVRSAVAGQQAAGERRMAAMGVDPRSGRFQNQQRQTRTAGALAEAGAANNARRQVEETGRSLRSAAVNMGSGFAVNPATSIGISNSGMGQAAGAAQQGNAQMGSMLNQQYQSEMAGHRANQQSKSAFAGALGQIGGMAWMMSSKDYKTDKRAAPGVLDALHEMPVERWRYKEGMADEGEHIGPYAEDFQRATGLGDGKSIGVLDAIGVTMGAVKELSDKVDRLNGEDAA